MASVTRKISENWKVFTDEQKLPYTKKNEDDKKRYETQMN